MSSRSNPSLLSQSTTSTVVAPYYDDGDKDYEMALANMMSAYGVLCHTPEMTSMCPKKEHLVREKRRGTRDSVRGSSQRAQPQVVKEEEEGGEEAAAAAADEADPKKPVQKEKTRRWSLKPMFRRSR